MRWQGRDPITPVQRAGQQLIGGNDLVDRAGLLSEITGGRRRRIFRYDPYLALLRDDSPREPAVATNIGAGEAPARG